MSELERVQRDLRIDLETALAIEELSHEHSKPYSEMCADFLGTDLWKRLNRPNGDLWAMGSTVIAECYDAERESTQKAT